MRMNGWMTIGRALGLWAVWMAGMAGVRADWSDDRAAAERWFAEGSYARAAALYAAAPTNLPPDEARWVAFRAPDSRWRSESGNLRSEPVEAAVQALDREFPVQAPEPDRDEVWALAQESLGDLHRQRQDPPDWTQTRYQAALDWWAGRSDLDRARGRYLGILWKLSQPAGPRSGYRADLPLELLNNAVAIAREPADMARARHLRATALSQLGPPDERALYLVEDDFQGAIAGGKGTEWHDDALFQYALWLERAGRLVLPSGGGWMRGPDPVRALERFDELVRTYSEGESRYWRAARDRARAIRAVSVGLGIPGVFLPDSEVQFQVVWRNVPEVAWTLHPLDLAGAVRRGDARLPLAEWLSAIPAPSGDPVAQGRVGGPEEVPHQERNSTVLLTNRLAPGAYLLEARAGSERARDLVLVTDLAVTLKVGGRTTLAWVTDALTGRPVAGARVVAVQRAGRDGGGFDLRDQAAETGDDGVARFDLAGRSGELLVAAVAGGRPALAQSWANAWYQPPDGWKVYAFTDRPAYRPSETVSWKFTARRRSEGADTTPAGAELHYEIVDPRGTPLTNGVVRLNDFGSAWGETVLGPEPDLGVYHVQFWTDAKRSAGVGGAGLFRVEEYKLPEFEVRVETPTEKGPDGQVRSRSFKLGETIEVAVQADSYFGGPVADAEVEVQVRRSEWHPGWPEPMPYPWLRSGEAAAFHRGRFPGGPAAEVMQSEVLRTDAGGRAVFRIPTEAAGGDVEFRIEARVVDASRREVTGHGTVRATRQRYFVQVRPERRVPRPGERVPVEVRAQDANGRPVQVEGRVRVTRETWREVWWDPQGREVAGDELEKGRVPGRPWPPAPGPGEPPWRLKSRGYESEEVRVETLRLGTNGVVRWEFTPPRDGFYRIAWSSPGNATAPPPPDARPRPYEPEVTAEGTLWAGASGTRELGYLASGVELLVDAASVQVGRTLPVMVATDGPGRWVLLTTELGDAVAHQVVECTGRARLVEIAIEERHVPNLWLGALMVRDRQVHGDTEEVQVPPESRFLAVEVDAGREAHEPREEARLRVVTRDHRGRGVPAEVALALVDDSVFAIQPELAPDPREFFHGERRGQQTRVDGSLQRLGYIRLVRDREGRVRDDRLAGGDAGEEALLEEGMEPVLAQRYGLVRAKSRVSAERGLSRGAAGRYAMGIQVNNAPGVALMDSAAAMPVMAAAGGAGGEAAPAVVVRSDFRNTALWRPDLVTGADGTAEVTVRMPESLTRWRATARGVTSDGKVGQGTAETRTRQPLMVRLQTPRFLVVGDRAWVAALVDNRTPDPLDVAVDLGAAGVEVGSHRVDGAERDGARAGVRIPAGGTVRVEWPVRPGASGPLRFEVTARSGRFADAMARTIPVEDHGLEKRIAVSGVAKSGDGWARLVLPAERRPGGTRFAVRVTPSVAVSMIDALPYLADYPYGCTEQTLSRFLPAVIVRRTLRDLGLDPAAVMKGTFGGIEPGAAAATHPGGRRDLDDLDAMVVAGVERLREFQRGDGAWGWWKEGEADAWMTAYVVWGLTEAAAAGVDVGGPDLGAAAGWLRARLVEFEDQPDQQAWMLHALAGVGGGGRSVEETRAFDRVLGVRDQLNPYTRALLALAAHRAGRADDARLLVRNLENGVRRGNLTASVLAPGAAGAPEAGAEVTHWGETSGWWRWSAGAVESTAFVLRALVAVEPGHPLVDSSVRWMLGNRRAAQWNNTRDTALSVLALDEFLRARRESVADLEFAVEVNGREIGRRRVSGSDPASFATLWTVPGDGLRTTNEVRIRRIGGASPIYFNVAATCFTTEEPVTPAGDQLFVRRDYFRLVPRPTLLKGVVYDRVPLGDGGEIRSGERVEVVVTVEAKHDMEYLVLEDLKPAALEAVELRSGGWLQARSLRPAVAGRVTGVRPATDYAGGARGVYPEWRDRRAALFLDRLPEGLWEIRYELRAETPGEFHALPAVAEAMYVPELRANGAEIRLRVRDGER